MDDKPTAGLRDLFEAVHGDEDDAVVRLLRAGAPAEATDEDGTTALYAAAVNDRAGAVRLLLAAGADPDRPSGSGDDPRGGDLPLCAAAVGGHTEVVRALLAAGARPDLREAYGFTALIWAAGRGHAETARALLEHGADPDLPGPSGEPPLVLAARRGSPATVRVLLRHRAAARQAALEEARQWLERDVEHMLRQGLAHTYGALDGDGFAARRVAEEGGGTVVVELLRDGRPVAAAEQQTGHAAVVTRLECVLGIETPAGELAERAVRSRSPVSNDWREAVAVLWQRADEATLRAAEQWCAESSTALHQTFAADVLARAAPGVRAVPLLRELASRPGPTHLTRAAVRALGRHADPSALPDVLRHATHQDGEVRRRVAEALGRLGPRAGDGTGAPARAAAALLDLARDDDLAVRREAVIALARTDDVSTQVCDVLAEQVGAEGERWTAAGREEAARPADTPATVPAEAEAEREAEGEAAVPAGDVEAEAAREADGKTAGPGRGDGPMAVVSGCGGVAAGPRRGPRSRVATPLSLTDPAYAEAARGLAVRQDPRAVGALLRVLADGAPEGPGRAVAVEAVGFVRDAALRRRLEWTSPRLR
ncbi:ankyrin repeat domain-containing protein [Streptomyces sp. CA-294286]|uniref:ankyrin repeat domain-containing protein n=1 Tax=Streptomyces sp. CA-294286 TaxID=3240070 RepID=UPI003D90880F